MPLDPTFRARMPGFLPRKTLAELASEHAEIPFLTERWLALQAARAARAARERKRPMTRTEVLLATARAVMDRLRHGRAPPTRTALRSADETGTVSAALAPLDTAAGDPPRTAVVIDFETARRRLRGR